MPSDDWGGWGRSPSTSRLGHRAGEAGWRGRREDGEGLQPAASRPVRSSRLCCPRAGRTWRRGAKAEHEGVAHCQQTGWPPEAPTAPRRKVTRGRGGLGDGSPWSKQGASRGFKPAAGSLSSVATVTDGARGRPGLSRCSGRHGPGDMMEIGVSPCESLRPLVLSGPSSAWAWRQRVWGTSRRTSMKWRAARAEVPGLSGHVRPGFVAQVAQDVMGPPGQFSDH